MSEKFLNEMIYSPLLKDVKTKFKPKSSLEAKISEDTRKQLEKLQGVNIIILDAPTLLYFKDILDTNLQGRRVSIQRIKEKLISIGEKVIITDEALRVALGKRYLDKTYVIGTNFRNHKNKIKRAMVDLYLEKAPKEKRTKKDLEKEFFSNTEFDHGVRSAPFSASLGISRVFSKLGEVIPDGENLEAIAQSAYDFAIDQINDRSRKGLEKVEAIFGENYREDLQALFNNVILNWKNFVDANGNVSAKLQVIVRPLTKEQNNALSHIEKELIKILRESIQHSLEKHKIVDIEGSPSIKQKAGKAIIDKLKPKVKVRNRNVVVTVNSRYDAVKLGLSSTTVGSATDKGPKPKSASAPSGKLQKPRVKVRGGKAVLPDIRSFIGILNQRLPTKVAENMGSPRLNYRTGRFANSTRVNDIQLTSKGFPSIEYTYMRYPYEVFEFPGSGSPLALQGERDPRTLIDKSIREIMAEFAVGRFYTRRV